MKILLVDDEEKNIELLEALLIPGNVETITACNGEEALRILGETQVDMVLLDVMLPGMSGIEVLKTIRASAALQLLPVLLITALSDRDHKIEGLKAGADDYISKPFDKTELLARVRTLAQLSFLRRQIVEKEKFNKILEATNEGIVVTDGKFMPVTINQVARGLLQIGSELPQNIVTHINGVFKDGIASGSLERDISNYIIERSESEKFNPLYLSTAVHKVKNTSGEIIQYIFIFKNVTSEHLESKLKYNFLSLISHKFKTPLTVMKGSVELLGDLVKDAPSLEYLKMIGKNQQELEHVLDRLVRFIEIDKKDLNETIPSDIVESYVARGAKQYGVEYSFNKVIEVGKIAFWQGMVLEELIDNSFKFFSGGKLQLDLVINASSIALSDNGPGIPPEEKEKIFEPFYQVEKDFTGQVPGMGLGLALVRKLVGLHNGSVEFNNSSNNGTSIRINLLKPPVKTND